MTKSYQALECFVVDVGNYDSAIDGQLLRLISSTDLMNMPIIAIAMLGMLDNYNIAGTLRILLEQGADPNIPYGGGETPIARLKRLHKNHSEYKGIKKLLVDYS